MLLALNKVEGDNISGVCFVGLYDLDALRYFVLAPLSVGVVIGLCLILAGIVSLNHVRQVIQHDERNQEKLKKFMIRIGVFSCLYLVPLVTLLACYTYEQSHRSTWENTWINDRCQEYSIPCSYKVAGGYSLAEGVMALNKLRPKDTLEKAFQLAVMLIMSTYLVDAVD